MSRVVWGALVIVLAGCGGAAAESGAATETTAAVQPEVGSAIVRFTPVIPGTVAVRDEGAFFRVVRAAFGQRRKTVLNALAGADIGLDRKSAESLLLRAGIDPSRRGETLSLEEFARLANAC